MPWRSDELHHRSAELSGWCAELRAADPAAVDETVPGAVAYAAETSGADAPGAAAGDGTTDADTPAEESPDAEPLATRSLDRSDCRCGFCDGQIAADEAVDAEGVPFPTDAGFTWAGDCEIYHRECVPAGDGRFLPWGANGVLGDEAAE